MENKFSILIDDLIMIRDKVNIIRIIKTINKFLTNLEDPKVLDYLVQDSLKAILIYDIPKKNHRLFIDIIRVTYNIIQFDCCFYR